MISSFLFPPSPSVRSSLGGVSLGTEEEEEEEGEEEEEARVLLGALLSPLSAQ